MNVVARGVIAVACTVLFGSAVWADERENYSKDAEYAEGTPPMVPHRIDDKTSEACLACHRTGLNGAPISPHPIRLDCTECHGQGEITKAVDRKRDKKSRSKEKHKD